MKVLHVVPALGSIYGGSSISVISLAKSQAQLGAQLDIVTTNMNGAQQLDVPLQTWLLESNYRIQYFPCWHLQDYKISPSLSRWLNRHVKDYDIVNTHSIFSYTISSAYQACQRDRIPYLIHPHGMLETWAIGYKQWKKKPYYSLIEKKALERASAIRVLAKSEAQSIRRLGLKTPLALVPNGISEPETEFLPTSSVFHQAFPETEGKTIILFLGRIDPKKGLDLLATAFSKVNQIFPHTHLVVAGPDNIGYLPTVKQYFSAVRCLNAVTFTGMLTGTLKYAALAAANLYVAPSYSEGFSMSVLEGMAAALPCIITTGCNFPEAKLANVAHVVDVNADTIAKALEYCLRNSKEANTMGQRARQFIFEKYTWDKIATNLIGVYESILNNQLLPYYA